MSGQAYIYRAALHCEACGAAIRERLTEQGHAPADPTAEHTYDSDRFPKGPLADGGGESDSPQHCDTCGTFLENPLTEEGYRYVADALAEAVAKGERTPVLDQWADYYGAELREWSKRDRILDDYSALKLWRERWVFTPAELEAPGRCNVDDVFIADPPEESDDWSSDGVQVNRAGEVSDKWADGTVGVPELVRSLAGDVEGYSVPADSYRNGDERDRHDGECCADEWRDVLRTRLGFFARFAAPRPTLERHTPGELAPAQIRELLDVLNSNYGRGELVDVTPPENGAGHFTRKPYQCTPERRSYRVSGRTVYALGHQRTAP